MSAPPATTSPAFTYRWTWTFHAPPVRVWPFVSDTQRFNEATGLPATEVTQNPDTAGGPRRTLRFRRFGLTVAWDEYPFEWVQPRYFGVLRVYRSGPIAWMRVYAQLDPRPDGNTDLIYEVRIHPSNPLGYLVIPIQVNWLSRRTFDRVFRQIDAALRAQAVPLDPFPLTIRSLQPAAEARIQGIADQLSSAGHPSDLIARLIRHIRESPDADLMRVRPFAVADAWGADRFQTLELFLRAAKLGLLDVSWDLLCPECRGAPSTAPTLANVHRHAHCPSCNIDFEVDFDHNIEVTFHPNPGIKQVEHGIFCVGGPQNTPHIVAQQALTPHETRICELPMPMGNYRIRGPRIPGRPTLVEVGTGPGGNAARSELKVSEDHTLRQMAVIIDDQGIHPTEEHLKTGDLTATFDNRTDMDQVVVVEHTAWSDQAATAAQVTTLQAFRDLFSSEALRPMEQIAVTNLTVLFTDLKGSTGIYTRIGDAPAFRRVMDHFTVLKDSVAGHRGSIVKTIGDAIMAAFVDPVDALAAGRDMLTGIAEFNDAGHIPPLTLKVGIHRGPCIAINQNDRLDYFGTTVNIASRIEGQSAGGEVVVSEAVMTDPGVVRWLETAGLHITPFIAELKGYQEAFPLYRVRVEEDEGGVST